MVTDLLVEHFPQVMDMKFTGHMEGELDQIETHKVGREKVLTEFWEPFRQSLEVAKTKMQSVKGQETDEKCPLCAKALVVRFSRKRGSKFLGCSGYPECKYIKPGEGGRARQPLCKCRAHLRQAVDSGIGIAALPGLLGLSRVPHDHELRRRRQAGPGQQTDRARL